MYYFLFVPDPAFYITSSAKADKIQCKTQLPLRKSIFNYQNMTMKVLSKIIQILYLKQVVSR